MKLFAALLITAVAAVANASITWDYPVINGLPINNACYTATTFKSLTPITYCTETAVTARYACRMHGEVGEMCRKLRAGEQPHSNEYLREETKCVAYASEDVEVSRTVTSQKCVRWTPSNEVDEGQCLEWATVTSFAGTRYKVTGYEDHGEATLTHTKRFDIPACR